MSASDDGPAPEEEPTGPSPASTPAASSWPEGPRRKAPVGLGIASMVIAVIVGGVLLTTSVAAVPASREFRDAIEAGRSTADVITVYDALALPLFAMLIVAYVVSCLWLQVARDNAAMIDPDTKQRGRLALWLGWWVPIISFWFPFEVVNAVQKGSGTRAGAPIHLGPWWASWLVILVGNRIAANLASSTDLDRLELLAYVEGAIGVAAVISCVSWCRIVHRVTANQVAALDINPGPFLREV